VVPPMLAGQFRIGEAKAKTGAGIPVAVVLWASVSADVDKRLTEMGNAPTRLRPEEWTSGDILWLVHAAGEARFIRPVLKHLNDTTFKGRAVKIRGVGPDGKPVVRLLPTNEQAQSEALSRMAAGQPTLDGAIRQTSHANEMVAAK
jgi:hemolysin-activating ACP:hemolysin acyltransferase